MPKAIAKYLLPLCILLCAALGVALHAQAEQQVHTPSGEHVQASYAPARQAQQAPAYQVSDLSRLTLYGEAFDSEEEEEDKKLFLKRVLERSHFLSAIVYDPLTQFIASLTPNRLSLSRHYTQFSALNPLYLVVRVLRL
ncbi:hypothetical protein AB9P05_03900 [Roseivirga sp. BDSF3-8]|uniref:hypothetical protein n=1 Tax=Roseivirga sp. BDSF3-8 TaxID=3241598 RepID=UPI0035323580